MAVNWSVALGVRDVALKLMRQRHEHLIRNAVRVEYLHRDDAPKQGGRDRLCGVAKITSLNAFLAGRDTGEGDPFFVLWIPEHVWDRLEERQREGLVDHALCMMDAGQDEEGAVKLAKNVPDFVGFNRNIQDFGFWWDGAQEMFEAMRRAGQLSLDLADGDRSTRPVLEIVGRGELAHGDDGRIPAEFRVSCGDPDCGCAFDRREFAWCQMCGWAPGEVVAPAGSVYAAAAAVADESAREPAEGEYPEGGLPAERLVDEGEEGQTEYAVIQGAGGPALEVVHRGDPEKERAADAAAAGDGVPQEDAAGVDAAPALTVVDGAAPEKPERFGKGRWSSRSKLAQFQEAQRDGAEESPLVGGLTAGAE